METITYDPNLITEDMIIRREIEIWARDITNVDSYPYINKLKIEIGQFLRLVAIKELKKELKI